MQGKIWLIGGTSDSVTIANIFTTEKILFVVSVTTQTAQFLYPGKVQVAVGCLNQESIQSFCQEQNIKAIVDASHPYAVEISQQAIAVSTKLNIPYLRYERSNYQPANSTATNVIELESFEALLTGKYLEQQRVLLTVGCKVLPQFQTWQTEATLYARILPKLESLKTALAAGFTSDRLIALRPPISLAMETALWQQWEISLVVTKASGSAGGEDIKRQVAANLNIPLIIITRPPIVYPQQTSSLQALLAFVKKNEII
ncbi:MAG: cobalt-precorrin-6A reductase [Waterburya sp.]